MTAQTSRAPRAWHIEARYGHFYATCQYGGFTRHGTHADAVTMIERHIEQDGDAWAKDRGIADTAPVDLQLSIVEVDGEQRLTGATTLAEWHEAIWTEQAMGFGEKHCRSELASNRRDLDGLNAGRITPRRIIGAGVRKPKTAARNWLTKNIEEYELAIETRGRSLSLNQSNATGYAAKGHAALSHTHPARAA